MFVVLMVVVAALALVALLIAGRARGSTGDPAGSVEAFHRALSAMEPGGSRDADGPRGEAPEPGSDREEESGGPQPSGGHPGSDDGIRTQGTERDRS